jgi:predicted nucleic acid-binding protein
MNGSKILFDTNVLIRFLNGDRSLIPIIDETDKYISFLTEIELYCKPA